MGKDKPTKPITFNDETEAKRMQVAVKDLLPNPYRRMDKYHLQPERLNALVRSIRDTSFWDNILARPNPDGSSTFQIAYGHHRLEAVKMCNIKKVNIPVKDLDDALMVKIMANENQSDWHMDTAVMNETIWAVQDFIINNIEDNLGLSKRAVTQVKKDKYVGEAILIDFLGKSWAGKIRTALELRKLEDENPELLEATEEIRTPSVAKAFQKAARDYNLPKDDYKKVAKRIQGNGTKAKPRMSAREAVKEVRSRRPKPKESSKRDALIAEIEQIMGNIDDDAKALYNAMWRANQKLKMLDVNEISGMEAWFHMDTLSKLVRTMREYMKFFGFTERDLLSGGNNYGE